ncbi:response regulator [Bacillus sp. FJAT-42376]|nr:response regulator [Bacillus sp. FJAT-42376]
MKVLITDDEIQVRKGLRMKVRWEDEGFIVAGEAANGQEALDVLRSIDIEVLITDMRMPLMNGLELARVCQEEFPHVKVVVLSGYSDYELVRGSMKEGVKDYLLKPVAPDELLGVLHKIKAELKEERKRQAESSMMRQLFHSQLQEVQEQYLLYLVKEEIYHVDLAVARLQQLKLEYLGKDTVSFQLLSAEIRDGSRDIKQMKDLWLPFRMLCKEISDSFDGVYTFYDPSYAMMMHFLILSEEAESDLDLAAMIQDHAKKYLHVETVVGVGKRMRGLENLKKGYISSLLAWSQSELHSNSQVVNLELSAERPWEFSADLEKKLLNAIESCSLKDFERSIKDALDREEGQSVFSFSFSASRVLFLLESLAGKYDLELTVIRSAVWNCQQSIWEFNSRRKVMEQLLLLAEEIINKIKLTRLSNGRFMIDSVRQYVDKHYSSEISLTMLADLFHINSSYLSEKFKLDAGLNFSDYLVKLRMEKASSFLKDKKLKIIDVANLVGFSSSGYFSTVFKKHFGCTPVEFRTQMGESIEQKNGGRG